MGATNVIACTVQPQKKIHTVVLQFVKRPWSKSVHIDQLYIFEHEWGTQKHIGDLKKILMVHTSTKEN